MRFIVFLVFAFASAAVSAFDFADYRGAMLLDIAKNDGNSYYCSSVLYSKKILLTAAHCLDGALSVRVIREYNVLTKNTHYEVKDFAIHPEYDGSISNYMYDVGAILLEAPAQDERPIYPVENIVPDRGILRRVGYGMRYGVNARWVSSEINDFQTDSKVMDAHDAFSVMGDSGGAIFQVINGRHTLVAIHSTKEGDSIIAHELSDLLPWIDGVFD